MATRSSAKLLHSKSYAETRKHAETSFRLRRTKKISGGGWGHQYIIFYCAKIVLLLSSHLELRGVTPVQSHHFSPQGYSQPSLWRDKSGWRKKNSSKSTGRRARSEEKERHHLHFPPCSAIQLLVFIIVTCSSMCRGRLGQLTLRWREHNNHWPFRKVMSKHNAYYSCDILYKYCNTGHVQCHHVCSL